jgi:hypothetical protein
MPVLAPPAPNESVIWYQQQVEIIGARGRIWVSLNQGWTAWIDGVFSHCRPAWPYDDELAQGALFAHLQRVLVGDENWQMSPPALKLPPAIKGSCLPVMPWLSAANASNLIRLG